MSLLRDLHRAYDGPLPALARLAARLGGAVRWPETAGRRQELDRASMLQSVVALQPSLVSPSNTWAERLRWRAAALACRDANIARNLPYEKSCRTAGCQAVFWRYAADISQHEANVARAGSKDQS